MLYLQKNTTLKKATAAAMAACIALLSTKMYLSPARANC